MHNNGFRIRKVAFLIIISFVIIWYICAFRSRRSPTRLDVHLSRSPKTHEASSLLQDDNLRTGEGVSVTSVSHKRPESETSPDPHTNGETSQDLVPEPKDTPSEHQVIIMILVHKKILLLKNHLILFAINYLFNFNFNIC